MSVTAIIVAAGSGQRLGADIPKALIQIAGSPIVLWSAEVMASVESITNLVIIAPSGFEDEIATALSNLAKPFIVATGGEMRTDSVRNGLRLVPDDCDFVAIHDAARPLVLRKDIEATILAAQESGAAVLGVPVADTLKSVDGDYIVGTVDRNGLWAVQTPQVFRRDLITEAISSSILTPATDDSVFIERIGHAVKIVKDSRTNLKITYSEDLAIAEAILKGRLCT